MYFKDIASVEYKKPSFWANGYIKFIFAGTIENNASLGVFGSTKGIINDPIPKIIGDVRHLKEKMQLI